MNQRNRIIIRTNMAGILMNLLLAAAKLIVGMMIHSRAVRLDAVNGFSDMLTSFLSIVSAWYSGKRMSRAHPFGFGRLEYISSMFCSAFVVFTALHASYDTVRDLIRGTVGVPDYNIAVVVLMAVSMAAKIVYGILTRRRGRKINATALIMIGTESMGDAITSAAILVSILLSRVAHINLEPWLTLAMSVFIVYTGITMFRDCADKLLGAKGDPEVYRRIKSAIAGVPEVLNVFFLAIHNYGEELSVGSVDIEVDDSLTAADTTRLSRRIRRIGAENGVRLISVGIYGTNAADPRHAEMWDRILAAVSARPDISRAYAFSCSEEKREVSFLVVADPASGEDAVNALKSDLKKDYPDYVFEIDSIMDY